MRLALILCVTVGLAASEPNGYYHQEYNFKTSSKSFRNNELQHQNEDQGFYAKDGDIEGRLRPKVNSHSQHSEYVNPRLRDEYGLGQTQSYGQLNAQEGIRGGVFDQGYLGQVSGYGGGVAGGGYGQSSGYQSGSSYQSYGVNSNLRTVTETLQNDLARDIQAAVYDQHRRASAYSNSLSESQIQSDLRELEADLRRNLTARLQNTLKTQYGNQGIRGSYSYSIQDGRLQPMANYNNQELTDITRQLENNLLQQLQQQFRTHYHTTTTHQQTNEQFYRPNEIYGPRPVVVPVPAPLRHPVVTYPETVHVSGESLTTVGTRVQNDLNEHLNRILDDTQRRYFTSGGHYTNSYNFDNILNQLQNELRSNITLQFDNQLRQGYARRYSEDDLENLKRQIESNLITKLNRDFNRQRERYFETYRTESHQSTVYGSNQQRNENGYYPSGQYNYQADYSQIQRQLQEDLSRQLQAALVQQKNRQSHLYASTNINPQANYQATLQELTSELNRNLTRQLEASLSQYQRSSSYDSQYANLRNQLQSDLQRQLQQGLQQSYSQYSSWSSSSSSSSNYRPVRGFDNTQYQAYGAGNVNAVGEDCMMGDDPSAYQNDDLTQQIQDPDEDLTQQDHDDLTQQVQDPDEDLTQQVQDPEEGASYGHHYVQKPRYISTLNVKPLANTQQVEDVAQEPEDDSSRLYSSSYGRHYAHNRNEERPRYTSTLNVKPISNNQQAEDLTQQVQQPEYDSSALHSYTGSSYRRHQARDEGNLRYTSTLNAKPLSNNEDASQDLTQQVQQPEDDSSTFQGYSSNSYGRHHARYISPVNVNQDSITQQVQEPERSSTFHSYRDHHLNVKPLSSNQQVEDVSQDLTQQVQQPEDDSSTFQGHSSNSYIRHHARGEGNRYISTVNVKPLSNNQQVDAPEDSSTFHSYGGHHLNAKPLSSNQQVEDVSQDLTQQVQQPEDDSSTFHGHSSNSYIRHHARGEGNRYISTVNVKPLSNNQQVDAPEDSSTFHSYGGHHLNAKPLSSNQQVEDVSQDLTQQVQQPEDDSSTFQGHSSNSYIRHHAREEGNRYFSTVNVKPLLNKPEDSSAYHSSGDHFKPLSSNQQVEDVSQDVTQQVQEPEDYSSSFQGSSYGRHHIQEAQNPRYVATVNVKPYSSSQTVATETSPGLVKQRVNQFEGLGNQETPQTSYNRRYEGGSRYQSGYRGDYYYIHRNQEPNANPQSPTYTKPVTRRQPEEVTQQQQDHRRTTNLGQEIDDSSLTQQTVDHGFSKPLVTQQQDTNILDVGQQVDTQQQTQSINHGFTKPIYTPQKPVEDYLQPAATNLNVAQEIDDSDLTQQVESDLHNKPIYTRPKLVNAGLTPASQVNQQSFNEPIAQVVDDSDLTQQTEDEGFRKLELGQQTEDQDLTQQIEDFDVTTKASQGYGNLQFGSQQYAQEVEDQHIRNLAVIAQQKQERFSTPRPNRYSNFDLQAQQQNQNVGFGQETDESRLSQIQNQNLQQQEVDNSDLTQQAEDLTQQLQQVDQNIDTTDIIPDEDLTQQSQNVDFDQVDNQQSLDGAYRTSDDLIEKLREKARKNQTQTVYESGSPLYVRQPSGGVLEETSNGFRGSSYHNSNSRSYGIDQETSSVLTGGSYHPYGVQQQEISSGLGGRSYNHDHSSSGSYGSQDHSSSGSYGSQDHSSLGSYGSQDHSSSGSYGSQDQEFSTGLAGNSHHSSGYSHQNHGQIHYGAPQAVEDNVEITEELHPVDQQTAHEVEQVVSGIKTKPGVIIATPVEPDTDVEIITTTPKTGFWSNVGNKFKNLKEKIG